MSDHYFTAQPASAAERRTLQLPLAGSTRTVVTAPGIFSPDHIDKGTRILLDQVPPPPPSGTFLDLGCGWGPLALTLGLTAPQATVWAIDVNERALDLARTNAANLGLDGIHAVAPSDVPPGARFDIIWSNPPIRVGKKVLHDLMHAWLPRLAPGGTAYLVVQKNLGSDSLHRWLEETFTPEGLTTTRLTSAKGFRILKVVRNPS